MSEFRAILPTYEEETVSELLGRLVSSWIDPRAITGAAPGLDANAFAAPAIFDVGLTRPVPGLAEEQEGLLVSLVREGTEGIRPPAGALSVLAHLEGRSYAPDAARLLQTASLVTAVTHLSRDQRKQVETFVRIQTSAAGLDLIRQPVLMLCKEFTDTLIDFGQRAGHEPFYEVHATGILDAYLSSRIAEAAGIPVLAGQRPGSGDSLSINLQFNRAVAILCDPPVSAGLLSAVRKASYNQASRQFHVSDSCA